MEKLTTVYAVIELYGLGFEINKCYDGRYIEIGFVVMCSATHKFVYRDADKSSARPTSRCILFDGENISIDACLVIYI